MALYLNNAGGSGPGSSGRLEATTITDADSTYAYMFWVMFPSPGTTSFNFQTQIGEDSNYCDRMGFFEAGNYVIEVRNGGFAVDAIFSPSAGVWYHLAVVRESSTSIKVYVNGAQTTHVTTNVGARGAGGSQFVSPVNFWSYGGGAEILMQDLKIWDGGTALTQADVQREMLVSAPRTPEIKQHLPLISNANSSGYGSVTTAGTVLNTPAYDLAPGYMPDLQAVAALGWTQAPAAVGGGVSGSGAAVLPGLTAAGTGYTTVVGDGAAVLPGLTALGFAQSPVTGNGAVVLPGLTATGTGSPVALLAGAATLPGLSAAGGGVQIATGAIVAVLPGLTAAGTGYTTVTGNGAAVLPGLTALGYGSDIPVVGNGAAVLPGLTAAGTGYTVVTGFGVATLPGLTALGLGEGVVLGLPPIHLSRKRLSHRHGHGF